MIFKQKFSKVNILLLVVVLAANVIAGHLIPDNYGVVTNDSGVQTVSAANYQEQKKKVDNKLNDINRKKGNAKKTIKENRAKAQYYRRLANKSTKEYKQLEKQLAFIEETKRNLEVDIKRAKEEYQQIVSDMESQVRTMYVTSPMSYVHILLESKSIADLISRSRIISNILEYNNDIIDEVAAKKSDLDYKLAVQEKQLKKINKQAAKKKKEMDRLTNNASKFNSKVANAEAYLDELEDMEDEMEKEAARLNSLIASMGSGGSAPAKRANGKYLWPVPSSKTVTSYFGNRIHPIFKTKRFHSGIDIAASSGQRIVAIASGTVIISGWQNGYGYTVSIDHGGGMSTLSAHASKLLVKTGEKVKAGQTVALVGSTGWSTGPHCHFEVRINGNPVDPLGGYI